MITVVRKGNSKDLLRKHKKMKINGLTLQKFIKKINNKQLLSKKLAFIICAGSFIAFLSIEKLCYFVVLIHKTNSSMTSTAPAFAFKYDPWKIFCFSDFTDNEVTHKRIKFELVHRFILCDDYLSSML